MLRFMTALAVVAVCLALPAIASADTGSITNVTDNGDGSISARYTTTGDCAGDTTGFCFWYPYAVQGPASQPCYDYTEGDGRLTYVGGAPPPDYIYEGPATDVGTDIFYPQFTPVRLCTYISYGDGNHVLAAQAVYTPPTTTEPPPSKPEVVPPLTVREGKSLVPGVLKKHYPRKFNRHTLKRSCFRYTTEKVRCGVSWRKRKYKYSGRVTMWNNPDDPANSFIYRYSIKRKHIHKPHHHSSGGSSNCDPNYSGCLNKYASDYDCAGGSGNGPYYTGQVRVLGTDHFDLDRDNDRVACEPSSYSASAQASVKRQVAAQRSAMLASRVGVGVGKR
jgi:hypothetical protein